MHKPLKQDSYYKNQPLPKVFLYFKYIRKIKAKKKKSPAIGFDRCTVPLDSFDSLRIWAKDRQVGNTKTSFTEHRIKSIQPVHFCWPAYSIS